MNRIHFLCIAFFLSFCGCRGHLHRHEIKPGATSNVDISDIINEKTWDTLFPHRYGYINNGPVENDFYSFKSFRNAAKHFPQFLAEDNDIVKRRELAAFLSCIAYETNDDNDKQTNDFLYRGLALLKSDTLISDGHNNIDTTTTSQPGKDSVYHYGRGPMQLRKKSDYQQFGEMWFVKDSILLLDPDELIRDSETSFASAIWWWTTAHGSAPSCHDVIAGIWEPTMADLTKGRFAGYGTIVNILTNGVKCGKGYDDISSVRRYTCYKKFCEMLHTEPGDDISCKYGQPFG